MSAFGREKKTTFSQASSVILTINNPNYDGGKTSDDKNGSNAGVIAGATIGAVAGVALIAVGAAIVVKKRNKVLPFNFQKMEASPSS